MNKIVFYVGLLLSVFTFTLNAQQNNTSFGIQGGANYARYTPRFPILNTEDVRYTGKIGFYLGGC